MVTNRRSADGGGADFYPTPPWGTKALLRYEKFSGSVLEPCCGDGAMSKVLEEGGLQVTSSDLSNHGYGLLRDVFDIQEHYDNIITNPPYNIANDIVEHCLGLADKKLCLLVRTAYLEGVKRYNLFYKENPPSRVYVFTQRLSMYPKGYPVKGGGTTSYSWIVWDKDGEGETKLRWIEPGLKENG